MMHASASDLHIPLSVPHHPEYDAAAAVAAVVRDLCCVSQNMYKGTQRSMLIPNVLFRVGGAAMLLTNKRSEARWVANSGSKAIEHQPLT